MPSDSDLLYQRRGMMLVISSPSGAGKSTLAQRLIKTFDDIELSVSATTRAPRPTETDGVEYEFLSRDDFQNMISDDAFLEWAKVFDHYYGTPRASVEKRLKAGVDVIFDVDWQGADALHDQMPNDVTSVFILPPSLKALEARLTARPGSTPEQVRYRMDGAVNEIRHWRRYDYVIINEDVDTAYAELEQLLLVERKKRLRQIGLNHLARKLLHGDRT